MPDCIVSKSITRLSPECIEAVEDQVMKIMDDLVDGNDTEDIMEELDVNLTIVGSRKTSEELTPY